MGEEVIVYDSDVVCACCEHEGVKTHEFQVAVQWKAEGARVPMNLCEVCSSSGLSHSVTWPIFCKDQKLHKALGWIANEILLRLPAKEAE